jgi:hypothetical protein
VAPTEAFELAFAFARATPTEIRAAAETAAPATHPVIVVIRRSPASRPFGVGIVVS